LLFAHDTPNYGKYPAEHSRSAGRADPPRAFSKLAPSEAGCESKNAFRRMKQPGCCI
jgi:hypothetical protein